MSGDETMATGDELRRARASAAKALRGHAAVVMARAKEHRARGELEDASILCAAADAFERMAREANSGEPGGTTACA